MKGSVPAAVRSSTVAVCHTGSCAITVSDDNWAKIQAVYPHAKRPTGPGDGGPCEICGEDMRAKEYPLEVIGLLPDGRTTTSGRYWHMKYEHGRMEDYISIDRYLARLGKEIP